MILGSSDPSERSRPFPEPALTRSLLPLPAPLRHLVAGLAVLLLSYARPAQALVVESFDDAAGFIPAGIGVPAPPELVTEGNRTFVRLADLGVKGVHNSVAVQQLEPLTGQVLVDFQVRITHSADSGRADGLGFALLDVAQTGFALGAAIPPPGLAEEPSLPGSLGVAFDIYESKDDQGNVVAGDLGNNHISVHFDGERLAVLDASPFRDLAAGDWMRVRLIVEPASGESNLGYVSLALTTPKGACTLLDRLEIEGLRPYTALPWLAARTGGESASFDVDTLRVEAVDPAVGGRWSLPTCWSLVPIHAAVLETGTVLTWDRHDYNHDAAPESWDPGTGALMSAAMPGYDAFCAGHSFLPDGRLLVTGGHNSANNVGVARATVYDPLANTWTRLPDMAGARWYPSNVTLANGDVLVLSGTRNDESLNTLPEVWRTDQWKWRSLTGADGLTLPLYPWAYGRPDGTVLVTGPAEQAYTIDPRGDGSYAPWGSGAQERDYGSSVLYAPGKVMNVGGSVIGAAGVALAPSASTDLFDLGAASPSAPPTPGPELSFPRRHCTALALPDGDVLTANGTSSPGFNDDTAAVLAPETWTPGSAAWVTRPPAMVPRTYHSIALLLPDACVLVAGGGHPAAAEGDHPDGEVYCPPYLYTGRPRPVILKAPPRLAYGQSFALNVHAAGTPGLILIRPAAVTHDFDQNQGLSDPLAAHATGTDGELTATAPNDPKLTPPGVYMLFALDDGVPSVATFVELGFPAPPASPAGEGGAGGDTEAPHAQAGRGPESAGGASGGVATGEGGNGGRPTMPEGGAGGAASKPEEPDPEGGDGGHESGHPPVALTLTITVPASGSLRGILPAYSDGDDQPSFALGSGTTALRTALGDVRLDTRTTSTPGTFVYTARAATGSDRFEFSVTHGEHHSRGIVLVTVFEVDHGCSCRVTRPRGGQTSGSSVHALLALALAWTARRRRRLPVPS